MKESKWIPALLVALILSVAALQAENRALTPRLFENFLDPDVT